MRKPFPLARLSGRALLFVARASAVLLSAVLLLLPLARPAFQDMSYGLYGADAPLMDSHIAEMILRQGAAIAASVMMAIYIYYRIKVIPGHMRAVADVAYLVVVTAVILFILLLLYRPVLQAPLI